MNPRFVVHEHHATHLHFDFRLEMEGVLSSWAVPKGPSMNPSDRRLAILVADHPLEYIDFEGIIPRGLPGAGPVVIWDTGTFTLTESEENKISFILNGGKLKGCFTLARFKGKGKGNEWLLIKGKDNDARSGWKLERCLTPEKMRQLEERNPPCKIPR